MARSEVLQDLQSLWLEHRTVHDGGYSVEDALVAYGRALDADGRTVLRGELLRIVASDGAHRGVALAALREVWHVDIADDLVALVSKGRLSTESEEQILIALLNLGRADVARMSVDHVERRMNEGDSGALVVAAALSKVDPDTSVRLSARGLSDLMLSGRTDHAYNLFQSVVHYYSENNGELLVRLITRIFQLDRESGRIGARLLVECLEKPWVRKRLGNQQIDEVVSTIRGMGTSLDS